MPYLHSWSIAYIYIYIYIYIYKYIYIYICLLQHTNSSFNQVRRDALKPHLDPICSTVQARKSCWRYLVWGQLGKTSSETQQAAIISLAKLADTGHPRFSPCSGSLNFHCTSKGFDPNWRNNIKKLHCFRPITKIRAVEKLIVASEPGVDKCFLHSRMLEERDCGTLNSHCRES